MSGFFASMISEKRADTWLAGVKNAPIELIRAFGGDPSKSGINVTQANALAVTAVYSCVKIISWTIASLPLHVYRSLKPRGKEKATDNPIYKMLHDAPNPEQTSFEWRAITSVHQNLWGAGISEIEFKPDGTPIALWPLPPWLVTPKRTQKNELVYEVSDANGATRKLWPYQVIVFPALSTTRDKWLSPIGQHRETIGKAIAVKEYGALTFGTGINPPGILSGLKFQKEDSEESIRKKFGKYSGLGGMDRLMLLEEGVKFEKVGLPPADAQYLDTCKFDISEIARIYNMPLHMLQEVSGTTSWGSGIEELNLGFIAFTLRPYLVQWEQEIKRRLLNDNEADFAEFLIEGLLRGKQSERFSAYAIARQWGFYSSNDIREIENMNPLPGDQGDIYLSPMNMVNAKDAGKQPKPVKKPKAEQIVDPSAPQGGK
jgi:HK97 family phage portal protein